MVAQSRNRVGDEFWGAMERPTDLVKDHPLPAMLLMFGMGLGVGVLISQTLCASLLDSLEEPTMTEKMRRQVYDTLSRVISPAMLKQLQNYTS
jgi:hypothetical protein